MEFFDELIEDSNSEKMREIGVFGYEETPRTFLHIESGDIRLSVQASCVHYCHPRITSMYLEDYSSMEFAMIKGDSFTSVEEIFPDSDLQEKLEPYFDGTVYGFVPVELINKLYLALKGD